jgi:hypothetical protein
MVMTISDVAQSLPDSAKHGRNWVFPPEDLPEAPPVPGQQLVVRASHLESELDHDWHCFLRRSLHTLSFVLHCEPQLSPAQLCTVAGAMGPMAAPEVVSNALWGTTRLER